MVPVEVLTWADETPTDAFCFTLVVACMNAAAWPCSQPELPKVCSRIFGLGFLPVFLSFTPNCSTDVIICTLYLHLN